MSCSVKLFTMHTITTSQAKRKPLKISTSANIKYTRRRQSAPSTVFGRALTVGEELLIIKEYNESQAKKKQAKEQRAVVRERKQREKVVSEHKDLHAMYVCMHAMYACMRCMYVCMRCMYVCM